VRSDAVLALNAETVELHLSTLALDGVVLVDAGETLPDTASADPRVIRLPLKETATKAGSSKAAGTVALGALLSCFGLSEDGLEPILAGIFASDVADKNLAALRFGMTLVPTTRRSPAPDKGIDRILVHGNEAVALGALAAGCRFYSAYPMTPSTSIMNALAARMDAGRVLVEQAEDEIAAINMAIGASYAGARAMTGTSGGGFCLMVEALGLAGMQELPLVVADIQRPGPVTGLPTRTEQGDLRFVVSASHGEFPRLVISLRSPADAFRQTVRAFDLADRYRIPVVLLGDQFLADTTVTVPPFPTDGIPFDRHLGTPDLEAGFRTYALTPDGISPRLIPGTIPGVRVCVDSDEHDEWGRITESAEDRVAMTDKRMRKSAALALDVEEPEFLGDPDFDVLVLCWGSIREPMADAMERLGRGKDGPASMRDGHRYAALAFGDVWPLPTRELLRCAAQAKVLVDIEQNATAQFAGIVREVTGLECHRKLLRYDGRPIGGEWIVEGLVKSHD
jgi:2-oxoglutarate ferredoxin oxidoreductase subunit alpha